MQIKVKASSSDALQGIFEDIADNIESKNGRYNRAFNAWAADAARTKSVQILRTYSSNIFSAPFINVFTEDLDMEAEAEEMSVVELLASELGIAERDAKKLEKAWF